MSAEPALEARDAAQASDPMGTRLFRVIRVHEEISGCTTLVVEPENEEGKALCSFNPGQFHMIYVFGIGEVPISISGDADNSDHLMFTVMGVGAVSKAITSLKVGEMVGLRGPFGSFWPMDKAKGKDVMIVAGGLGLAPLRSTIYAIIKNRSDYGRALLLYGSRRPENILYRGQLKEWNGEGKFKVDTIVDSAGEEWKGNIGVVPELIKLADFSPENTIAMVCGPEVMMRFSAYALMDRGMAPENIYVSMERNMKCAIGQCGRCQYGPYFTCKDGPVFSFDVVEHLFKIREV